MWGLRDQDSNPAKVWGGMLVVWLIYYFGVGLLVFPSSIPHLLQQHLSINSTELGMLASAFYFACIIMQIPAGLILDRLPVRLSMSFAIILIALGCFLMALTKNFTMIFVSRMLLGAGYAFAYVGCLVYARNLFVVRIFPIIIGLTGAVGGIGAISFTVIFDLLSAQFSWQSIIAVIAWLCVVIAGLVLWVIDSPMQGRHLQKVSIKNEFVLLIHRKRLLLAAAYVLFVYAQYSVVTNVWGIAFIAYENHVSVKAAVWINALAITGFIVGCPILGYLAKYIDSMKIIIVFAAIQTFILLFFMFDEGVALTLKMMLIFAAGVCASSSSLIMNVIKSYAPISVYGLMASVIRMFFIVGAVIFTPIVGWLYHDGTNKNAAALPMIVCSMLAVVFALLLYYVDKKYPIKAKSL